MEFIEFLYDCVVLKQLNKKGTLYYRFDVPFIHTNKDILPSKKINFKKNTDNKTKINHYFAYTKTMIQEL